MALRKLIYTPSGKAGEYANRGYAANIFKGCTHGCRYCYVPSFCHVTREEFHATVTVVPDMLERLQRDIGRVGVLEEPLFLCFTCDPYCIDAPAGITRAAIEIILNSGNRINILTKAGMKATKDFDLLASIPGNKIGTTLTFYLDGHTMEWEPKAAFTGFRLSMLHEAKKQGIETWASIEPVIIPAQSLLIMEAAIPYVDEFKIGKWNHDKRANAIDWYKFAQDAVALMERHGKKYMLKNELLKYL